MIARRLGRVPVWVYWALLGLILASHVITAAAGFFVTRVWEDEGYNLTVPLNLIHGLGYSSDGILTTGRVDPFDVRISTGPVVLLPIAAMLATGIDIVIGARIVMLGFYALAIGALFLAGRRYGGRWGALVAIAAPLGLDAAHFTSPLQGPTDVLGEWPAIAFTVLALYYAQRRPAVAGLMLGLAIQCKNLSVLSLPVLGLVVLFAGGPPILAMLRRAALFAVFVLLPTIVFELGKLIALGGIGPYLVSTREFIRFLRTGGQEGILVAKGDKIAVLFTSWFVPWFPVVLLVVAAIIVAVVALRRPVDTDLASSPSWLAGERETRWFALATLGVLLSWIAWWILSVRDPLWIRHPAPGLLIGVPLLLAVATRWSIELAAQTPVQLWRPIAGAAGGLLALVLGVQLVAHPVDALAGFRFESLPQQRAAAEVLREFPGDTVRGRWGAIASLSVLAGKRAVLVEPGQGGEGPWLIETFDQAPAALADQRARIDEQCGADRTAIGGYVLCSPR